MILNRESRQRKKEKMIQMQEDLETLRNQIAEMTFDYQERRHLQEEVSRLTIEKQRWIKYSDSQGSILSTLLPDYTRQHRDSMLCVGFPSILYSMPGGDRQHFHHDFPETQQARAFAFLYSISGDSKLWVSTNDLTGQRVDREIEFKQNSLLLFQASLEHAGAGYDQDNYRYHMYIDNKSREENLREIGHVYPTPNLNM